MLEKTKILGRLERVSFPELGVKDILAKVDTGAFSGALHCTGIKVVRRGRDRRRVLKFTPLGAKDLEQETENFKETYVRSATGHRQKRYIISTTIECGGYTYPLNIGLSNRSDMRREALLGRKFLRENNLLVDVRINSTLDDEGDDVR